MIKLSTETRRMYLYGERGTEVLASKLAKSGSYEKYMRKSIIIVIILLLIILGISYLGKDKSEPQNPVVQDNGAEMAKYFEAQIIALGVKDIGQPIEGFDAELVRLAFPGFITTDFEGVETFEGYYKVNGDRIEYIRSIEQPITSAERTISSKGYATLLKNTSARLSISATSKETIDSLIQAVNLAEKISLRIGEKVSALGVTITAIAVEEDSRCPADVTCVQAGTVRLKTVLGSGMGEAGQIFKLMEPTTTEAEAITLVAVEPAPKPQIKIEAKDYIFLFEIQKLPQEIIETSGGL